MLCQEIMKRDVVCVTPNERVSEAATRMRDRNVGFLPVCDDRGRVVGTLTDRDIAVRLVAQGWPAETRVSEIMTREVVGCRPDDDLARAEGVMMEHRVSRLVVLDEDGSLAGVISLSDVAEQDAENAAETMSEVASRETRAPH